MPLLEYEEYRPSRAQVELIDGANKLIGDYAAQGLSLTLRQLYYRFVAAGVLPNTPKDYKRLGYLVNRARLGGLMDWAAIEDRGRNLVSPSFWNSPGDIIHSAARSFRLDKWGDQPKRVEVWVEKQALESVVGQAADLFDVELDALEPATLSGLVQDAIRKNLDDVAWEIQVEAEDKAREGLAMASERWGMVEQFLREVDT